MARTKRTTQKEVARADPAWVPRFLDRYELTGSVTRAAKLAKIGRRTVYDEKARNPELAKAMVAIDESCVALAEDILVERFQDKSDPQSATLLIFYLKGRSQAKYGQKVDYEALRAQARREATAELRAEIERLPEPARKLLEAAMTNEHAR